MSIKYSEFMPLDLVILNAMRMSRTVLSYMARLALLHFSTLYHKRHDFRDTVFEHNMRFAYVYNFHLEHFFILRRGERCYNTCVLVLFERTRYSCPILMKLEFSIRFSKNTQISNFMKLRPVEDELFHAADSQTSGS